VSYLRLVPSHWAGDYACWGVENREAAIRVIPAAEDDRTWAANVEVKCFDLLANPYLLLAAVIAAGNDGVTRGSTLPGAVATDPAVLEEAELAARGIHRLPGSLEESLAAFVADDVLTATFGPELVESIRALRQSESDLFTDSTPEAITAANRWRF
jgi:glutamine synthetase